MRKRAWLLLLVFVLLLSMLPTAYAGDVCGESADWALSDDGRLVLTGTGKIEYNPWTSAGIPVKSVSVGEGITEIGEEVFAWHTMTEITLPESLTKIGAYAFLLCEQLKGIRIPANVAEIGESAFRACNSLTAFEVDGANAHYVSRNGVLLNKEENYLICYPAGSSGKSYEIPDSVSCIAGDAFNRCFNLESLTVGSGNNTYIAQDGVIFSADKRVLVRYPAGRAAAQYTIPGSVTRIEDFAFYDCKNLSTLTISESLTEVGDKAFYDCGSLSVDYAGTEQQWKGVKIGGGNDVLTGASIRYNMGTPTKNDLTTPTVSGKSVTATASCVEPLYVCFTVYGESGKFISADLRALAAETRQQLTFTTEDSGAKSYKIALLKVDGLIPVSSTASGNFTSGSSGGGGGSSGGGGGTHVPQPVQQICHTCGGMGGKNQLMSMDRDPFSGIYTPRYMWIVCTTCHGSGRITVYK